MFIVGVTGGIASGKSTVARLIGDRIQTVIDADLVSRELMQPGTDIYAILLKRYGDWILRDDGTINRTRLGHRIFCDPCELVFLNSLTHPAIVESVHERIRCLRSKKQDPGIVLLRAPLLLEVGLQDQVDMVVVVVTGAERRVRRMCERRNLTAEEARNRISAQLPDSEKIKHADFVIDNNGSLDALAEHVDELWVEIKKRAALHESGGSVRP